MDAHEQLDATIEKIGSAFDTFKTEHKRQLDDIERKVNRQRLGEASADASDSAPTIWLDTKTRQPIQVLSHKQRLADLPQNALSGDLKAAPSIGRLLRGIVLGGRADDAKELEAERKALSINTDPSGGYTVAGALSAQWIDLLRAKMVLSQAGCTTIPMHTSQLSIARVDADPTITWHGENAGLTASEPTFGSALLTAKTAVCLVKMSLELSQDSSNIDQILQSTLVNAMAGAIDSAGLIGTAVDAAASPAGLFNLSGRNSVTSIGAPTSWDFLVDGVYELLLDDTPMENIGAFVAHPAVWKKLRKLKTGISSDNTPLTAPAEIAALPKLWTTAAPLTGGTTAKGVIANWSDLLFGVRQDIQVRVLDQAFMGSNLQIALLAYARCDFNAARVESFCTLEGITV